VLSARYRPDYALDQTQESSDDVVADGDIGRYVTESGRAAQAGDYRCPTSRAIASAAWHWPIGAQTGRAGGDGRLASTRLAHGPERRTSGYEATAFRQAYQ
jgi:hypothetical protein